MNAVKKLHSVGAERSQDVHFLPSTSPHSRNDVSCKRVVRNRAARVRRCRREKLAGVSDPSGIYRFGGISEVKMMDCLAKLGRDVRIVVGPAWRAAGGNVKVALG
jgi:hypothetical protein